VAVALYVIACLAEREPVVITARLAAEIAAERTAYLMAWTPWHRHVSACMLAHAFLAATRTTLGKPRPPREVPAR
jgi:hypothetical protein